MEEEKDIKTNLQEANNRRKNITKVIKVLVTFIIPALKVMIPIIIIGCLVFWVSSTFKVKSHNSNEINKAKEGTVGSTSVVISDGVYVSYDGDTVMAGGYTYPVYDNQHDAKYKNIRYGTSTLYTAGCGVFSGAMLLSGLCNDPSITPESYVQKIEEYYPNYSSYFQSGVGSIYPGIYKSDFLEKTYGVKSVAVSSESAALAHLEKGYPVIAGIPGHILAVIPAPDQDKQAGAKFYVLDSIKRSRGPYTSTSDFATVNRSKNGSRAKGWKLTFRFMLSPVGANV